MNARPSLLAAGLGLIAGWGALAAVAAPKATAPLPPSVPAFDPRTGPAAPAAADSQVNAQPLSPRQYRSLRDDLATPPMAERPALFSRNIGHGMQVQAIGRPLDPLPGESRGNQHQVRVPLLTVAW
jgi:hypothetical protein